MPVFDTLKANGIERPLWAWGISRSNCTLSRFNKREDIYHATLAGANVSDDPLFAFETAVVLQSGRISASGADNSFSGGVIKFSGKRVGMEGSASGAKMGVDYEFQGPWYDLANTHYLQTFKGVAVNPYAPGEIILNTSTANATGQIFFISIGDQIQAILQWLLDKYAEQGMAAPFQYVGRDLNAGAIDLSATGTAAVGINTNKAGNAYNFHVNAEPTIDTALFGQFLPSYIAKPMMCSQAIEKMLELSPRTNIAFDYSTTPPTIHVRSVDTFAPVNLPLFNGIDHKSLNIKRRDDLIPRAIVLTYRITNTVDGSDKIDYAIDKWGPHGFNSNADPSAGLRVFCETIDLQGFSSSSASATLDCEPLACIGGTNSTKRSWWGSARGGKQTKLIDSRVRFQTDAFAEAAIPNATIVYAENDFTNFRIAGQPLSPGDLALFTHRIVSGTHHSWMASGASPVYALEVRVKMKVEHALYDVVATGDTIGQLPANETTSNTAVNGNRHGKVNTEEMHVDITLTNASNNEDGSRFTASTTASVTQGEIYILGEGGIAQYLYNSWIVMQYDGEYAKVEADFANNISMMNSVNFTGGREEWTEMNAQIQSIVEDFGTKETFVKIGVSNDLTAGQLSSLLNMWAFRRPWYNPAVRSDNSLGATGQISMPDDTPAGNNPPGIANGSDAVTISYATPSDPTTTVKGQVSMNAKKVADILAATSPTPFGNDTADTIKKLEPREVQLCDETGAVITAIFLAGGFYIKP